MFSYFTAEHETFRLRTTHHGVVNAHARDFRAKRSLRVHHSDCTEYRGTNYKSAKPHYFISDYS